MRKLRFTTVLMVFFATICCFNTVSAQCPVTVSGEGSAITFCYDIADTPPVLSNPTVNGDLVVFSSSTDNCVTYQSELNFGGKVGFALNDCEALFPFTGLCPDGIGSLNKACLSTSSNSCTYTNNICWLDAADRPDAGYYVYNGIALEFTESSETCLSATWNDSDNLSFPNTDGLENCKREACPVTVSLDGSFITFCYDIADTPPVLSDPIVNNQAVVFSSSTDNCVTYQSENIITGAKGVGLNNCDRLNPANIICNDGKGSDGRACKDNVCTITGSRCWSDASLRPDPGYYVYNGVALEFVAVSETCLSFSYSTEDNITFPNNDGFENCNDGSCPVAFYSCTDGIEICYSDASHLPEVDEEIILVYDNNPSNSATCKVGSINTITNCVKFSGCTAKFTSIEGFSTVTLGDCDPLTIESCPVRSCPVAVTANGQDITFCYAQGTEAPVLEETTVNGIPAVYVSHGNNCVTYKLQSVEQVISAPYSLGNCDPLEPQDVVCNDTSIKVGTTAACRDVISWDPVNGTTGERNCTYSTLICWEHEEDVPAPGIYIVSGAALELTAGNNPLCLGVSWSDSDGLDLTFPLGLDGCTPPPSCNATVEIRGNLVTFCYAEGEYFVFNKSETINGLPAAYQGRDGNCITYLVDTTEPLATPITYGNCTFEPFDGPCPDDDYASKECAEGKCYQTLTYCWDSIDEFPRGGTYEVNGTPYEFYVVKATGASNCIRTTFEVPAIDAPYIFVFEGCVEKCPISVDLGQGSRGTPTLCYPEGAEIPAIGAGISLFYNEGTSGIRSCKVSSFDSSTNCIQLVCENIVNTTDPILTVSVGDCDPIYVGDCPETVGFWNNSKFYIQFCYAEGATFQIEETATVNGQEATYVANFSTDNCIVYQLSDPDAIAAPYSLNECGPYSPFTGNCPTSQVSTKSCTELKGQVFCSQTVRYCWDSAADMPPAGYYDVGGGARPFEIYESATEYCLYTTFGIGEDEEVVEYPFSSCPVAYEGPCPDTSTVTSTPGTKHCESYNPDVNCVYSIPYTTYSICWADPADRPDPGPYNYGGIVMNFTASSDFCLRATWSACYGENCPPEGSPSPDGTGLAGCTKVCPSTVYSCADGVAICYDNIEDVPAVGSSLPITLDENVLYSGSCDVVASDRGELCIELGSCRFRGASNEPYTTIEVNGCDPITIEDCPIDCPAAGSIDEELVTICYADGANYEALENAVINGLPFTLDSQSGNCLIYTTTSTEPITAPIVFGDCTIDPYDGPCPDSGSTGRTTGIKVCNNPDDPEDCDISPGYTTIDLCWDDPADRPAPGMLIYDGLLLNFTASSENCLRTIIFDCVDIYQDCDDPIVNPTPDRGAGLAGCTSCPTAVQVDGQYVTVCYAIGANYEISSEVLINGMAFILTESTYNCLTYYTSSTEPIATPIDFGDCVLTPYEGECPSSSSFTTNCKDTTDGNGACFASLEYCWDSPEDNPGAGYYFINGEIVSLRLSLANPNCLIGIVSIPVTNQPTDYIFEGCRKICPISVSRCEEGGLTICYDNIDDVPEVGSDISITYDEDPSKVAGCKVAASDSSLCIKLESCQAKNTGEWGIPSTIQINGCDPITIEDCPIDCPAAVQVDGQYVTVCYDEGANYNVITKALINGVYYSLSSSLGNCHTYYSSSAEPITTSVITFGDCELSPYEGECPVSSTFTVDCRETTDGAGVCTATLRYCWDSAESFPGAGGYIINGNQLVYLGLDPSSPTCLTALIFVPIIDRPTEYIFEGCDEYNGPCPDFDSVSTKDCESTQDPGTCNQTVTYCWNNESDFPGAGTYNVNDQPVKLIETIIDGAFCLTGNVVVPIIDSPTEFIFENCRPNCPLTVEDMTDGTYRICFDTDSGLEDQDRTGTILINGESVTYIRLDAREGNCIEVTLATGIKEIQVNDCPGITPTVLPIELIYFEAEYLPGIHAAEVTWITVMELNVNYYQLERSLDGTHFEPVHYIRDIEDSNVTMTYRHEDDLAGIHDQIIYYRLKNVDHDGSFDYSEVIPLEVGGKARKLINIFPNPVKDFVNIVVPGKGRVVVFDVYGRTMASENTEEGDVLYRMDLSNFTAGNYFIRFIDEKNVFSDAHKITVVGY